MPRPWVTESNVAILHPGSHSDGVERCKPGNFIAGEQIPHDCRLADIITHDQATGTALAHIVHGQEQNAFPMLLEPTFNGQGVVMQAENGRVLRIEEDGRRSRARLEFKIKVARIYRCGRSDGRSVAR